ncbi:MAG TPA: sensor histidine kinase [Flavipsychrobacter sp.]|jgi:hypothetical protein|nr:sensor histidine kinase [Flavipsychrobacter sp.]
MTNQHTLLIFLLGTFILLSFSLFVVLFILQYKKRQQLFKLETINLEHQFQSQLLNTKLEVQEQAYKYLSEEIHDNVGQELSLVKLHLYTLSLNSQHDSKEVIQNATEVLSKAINDLRTISHNLNGNSISKNGLPESLQKEVSYINSAKSLKAVLNVSGIVFSFPPDIELLIFRIIQESLNNTIKHAKANTVVVTLDYRVDHVYILIKDDGIGFDTNSPKLSKSLGLMNIATRAKLLNAKLTISSEINHGTSISLVLKSTAV